MTKVDGQSAFGSFFSGLFSGATSGGGGGGKVDTSGSTGNSWAPYIVAGIQTVGSLIGGLAEADLIEEQSKKDEAWQREKFEWEKQQAGLLAQERASARRIELQKAAIQARLEAAKMDPKLQGYSRQAERLQTGAQIDQQALNSIISGYQKFGG